MKAIILISSIFYILGLAISNKIELVKRSNPVEKIISKSITTKEPAKAYYFKGESEKKSENDSIKGGITDEDKLLKK